MTIYIVTCNYFDDGIFGIYSSIKRARIALEHYFAEDESIITLEDCGYNYQFTTADGSKWRADICWNVVDEEFEAGICKEDK